MGGGAGNRFRIATVKDDILPLQEGMAANGTSIGDEIARAEAAEAAETARAEAAEAGLGFSGTVSSNTGALIVESLNTLQQAKMAVSHLLTQATIAVAGGVDGASQVNLVAGTSGGQIVTTDNTGTPRNTLDDGSGNVLLHGQVLDISHPLASVVLESDAYPQNANLAISHSGNSAQMELAGGAGGASFVQIQALNGGGRIKTSDADGADRNVLDDGTGAMTIRGLTKLGYGNEVWTTNDSGGLRNTLDDGNGLASISADLHVGGHLHSNGPTLLGHGSEVESTDGSGNTRNRLDDGNGNATVAGTLTVATTTISPAINMKIKYGLHGDDSTDDTALIRAGVIAEVAAAISDGTNYRELYFPPAVYLLSGATTTGTPYFGNAQIPLPIIPSTQQKVTLVFKGTSDASACYHWQQLATQQSGTVFHTTLSGTSDETNGVASVIGGPALAQGYGNSSTAVFSNMLIVIDGISILTPQDPHVCGFDFKGVAEANVKSGSALVATGAALIGSVTAPTQGWQFGLAMPNTDNNDNCTIGTWSAQGQNYGVILSEHTVATSIRSVYCVAGMVCAGGGSTGTPHGLMVFYASCEACNIGVQFNYDTANPTKITIMMMDYEAIAGDFGIFWAIYDPANNGRGEIRVRDVPLDELLNGGAELRVYNEDGVAGFQTAPLVPATTVAIQNPFFRDCAVSVAGGTVTAITVDGHATGLTTGTVFVPTCKTIAITYSVAPTWVWMAL